MSALGDSVEHWVGYPGSLDGLESDEAATPQAMREHVTRRLREEQGCEPVFIDDTDLYEDFYAGYSNATLWPLLHYMTQSAQFEAGWFDAYRRVNEHFADTVMGVTRPGDMVWVHDYQLMLLPAMLRERRPDLRVGFFLHVPFPSHEIFRVLPEREHLLRGLLGADLIGFHTFGYLRHFRSALLRGLDQESLPDSAIVDGRRVELGVFPIGHNRTGFDAVVREPGYATQLEELQREFAGRRLVLSVERLDYTKGIPQRLAAIDRFLDQAKGKRDDVVFLIIAVPSRQQVDAYQELTEQVQLMVGEINGRYSSFSRQPVHFFHRGTDPARLAALYAFADVALVTPLIDGMNLVAKEFVDLKGAPGAKPGTLILSETAGAAQELAGAILVNAYDASGVAEAINQALDRSDEEAEQAMTPMRQRVRKHDADAWARTFVDALQRERPTPPDPAAEADEALLTGLGAAGSLAVVLDYDGTLRGFEPRPEDAVPTEQTLSLLAELAALPRVYLAIVSGRPETFLDQHLGTLDAVLIAEHGFRCRYPGDTWEDTNPQANLSWLPMVRPILEQAADLTPGTHVEAKRSALVWHYRRADPEFGSWKAGELLGELTDVVANVPVEVHHGHKIVEVASQQVSKGASLERLLTEWEPDAAVAIGDDRTDETMFTLRHRYANLRTIKVGPGETHAASRLPTVDAVHRFLEQLIAAREGR